MSFRIICLIYFCDAFPQLFFLLKTITTQKVERGKEKMNFFSFPLWVVTKNHHYGKKLILRLSNCNFSIILKVKICFAIYLWVSLSYMEFI